MSPEAPLDPAGIANRQFATARRGLDSGEVRAYLQQLSSAVEALQRRGAELLAQAQKAEARAQDAERLDEHRLVELLGEETARVLAASREAAADIRTKAQEAAARLISEANEQAHQVRAEGEEAIATQRAEMLAEIEELRQEAASELDRRRAEGRETVAQMLREAESEADALRRAGDQARREARDDAEAIRAEAQEEGRQMVAEAQVVRERMLRDLARRRRSAREQLERLHAARDRLLAAYEVVRRTVAEATTELQVALPEAKIAGDQAMRRVLAEPEPTVEELEAQVSMARIAGLLDPLQPLGDSPSAANPTDPTDHPSVPESSAESAWSVGAGDEPALSTSELAPEPVAAGEDDAGAEDGEPAGAEDDAGAADAEDGDDVSLEPAVAPEVGPPEAHPLEAPPVLTGDDDLAVEPRAHPEAEPEPSEREEPAGGESPEPPDREELGSWADPERPHRAGQPEQPEVIGPAPAEAEAMSPGPRELLPQPSDEPSDDEEPTPDLDELFARLREGRDRPAHDSGGGFGAEEEDETGALAGAPSLDVDARTAEVGEAVEIQPDGRRLLTSVTVHAVAPSGASAPAPTNGRATDRAGGSDDTSTGIRPADRAGGDRIDAGTGAGAEADRTDPADSGTSVEAGAGAAASLSGAEGTDAGAAASLSGAEGTDAGAGVEPGPRGEGTNSDAGVEGADADGSGGDGDAVFIRRRDETLTSIERDMSRLLKRALADEQNEVLDLLRRTKPASVDELLPPTDEHAERYADAARDELDAAANWGAIHVAAAEEPPPTAETGCDALADELGRAVVEPLRERIARSFADTGGDLTEVTARLRALYREWKGQRIADAVRHFTVAAYARGAYAALPDGTPLRWLVDRSGAPCPDADDNALAGLVCKGKGKDKGKGQGKDDAFPTGDRCPPAHLGCRCLVIAEGT